VFDEAKRNDIASPTHSLTVPIMGTGRSGKKLMLLVENWTVSPLRRLDSLLKLNTSPIFLL